MLVDHTEISTDLGVRHIDDREQCLRGRSIVTIVSGNVIALRRLHYCLGATAYVRDIILVDANGIGVRLFLYAELVGQTNCSTRGILSKLSRRKC